MKTPLLPVMLPATVGATAGGRGMVDIAGVLTRWGLDLRQVRARMYRAPTPRERERWHALWLLAQGWPASKVAEVLDRDAHTIGAWVAAFRAQGPQAVSFDQTGG